MLAYPMLFVVAMATTSLAVIYAADQLLAPVRTAGQATGLEGWLVRNVHLPAVDAARFVLVLKPMSVGLGLVFLVTHLAAVPWARAAARAAARRGAADEATRRAELHRGYRLWLWSSLATAAALVVAGLGGWLWIFTR